MHKLVEDWIAYAKEVLEDDLETQHNILKTMGVNEEHKGEFEQRIAWLKRAIKYLKEYKEG